MDLIKRKFTSLVHREFRIFWSLQIFSSLGIWIQSASQLWLVYKLTNSPFFLGLVSAMQFMPVMLLSLFAGVIVDHLQKRKILLVTQSFLCILTFLLGVLTLLGVIRYWHILIFASILGIVNTLDMPARQSIIMEFVGREDLMNAVSLNSVVFNVARMAGPALAGVLMKYIGVGYCFIITSILYMPMICFLFKVKTNSEVKKVNINNLFSDIGDGLRYILSKRVLYVLVFLVVVMGIFALNYSVFVPVLAKDILGMDSRGYGNLMAGLGLGAFLGSVFVSLRKRKEPSISMIMIALMLVTVVLILSGYATSFWSVVVLLFLTGFFNSVFFTNANSMLMLNSDDEFRGRVMSVYTLAFGGTSPIGNLFSGTIIDKFSVKSAFLACGFSILITVSLFLLIQIVKSLPKPIKE